MKSRTSIDCCQGPGAKPCQASAACWASWIVVVAIAASLSSRRVPMKPWYERPRDDPWDLRPATPVSPLTPALAGVRSGRSRPGRCAARLAPGGTARPRGGRPLGAGLGIQPVRFLALGAAGVVAALVGRPLGPPRGRVARLCRGVADGAPDAAGAQAVLD